MDVISKAGVGQREDGMAATDVDAEIAAEFVARFEGDDPQEAVDYLLERVEDPRPFLTTLFGVGFDAWYVLVADDVSGRCLDATGDWGRTVPLLGALADEVHSVQDSEPARQMAEARADDAGTPVVAATDRPSLPDEPYETIVATEPAAPTDAFFARAAAYRDSLTDDGSLFLAADGWPRTTGLTDALGLEVRPSTTRSASSVLRATPSKIAAELTAIGFDQVECYAFLPTRDRFRWVVRADDPDAIEWVVNAVDVDAPLSGLLRAGATLAARFGVVGRSLPSYLVVCRNEAASVPATRRSRVLRRGANRSILFDVEGGEVEAVRKVPTVPQHAAFNERAVETVSALHDADLPCAGTLPEPDLEPSAVGPVLVESPASGTPLRDVVDGADTPKPAAFDRVLRTGLDWIRGFQRAHRGDERTRSPEAVRRELAVPRFDVAPPAVDRPVTLPVVPSHGDFHPGNFLVDDDGSVDAVIDWEYSRLQGDPVSDPAFYVLKLAAFSFGGFRDGVRTALLEETPHSRLVYQRLAAHCDASGLDPAAFGYYVARALVEQATIHARTDSPWQYHVNPREKADKVRFLYDNIDAIVDRLESEASAPLDDRQRPDRTDPVVGRE